jgi:hypothetical protein
MIVDLQLTTELDAFPPAVRRRSPAVAPTSWKANADRLDRNPNRDGMNFQNEHNQLGIPYCRMASTPYTKCARSHKAASNAKASCASHGRPSARWGAPVKVEKPTGGTSLLMFLVVTWCLLPVGTGLGLQCGAPPHPQSPKMLCIEKLAVLNTCRQRKEKNQLESQATRQGIGNSLCSLHLPPSLAAEYVRTPGGLPHAPELECHARRAPDLRAASPTLWLLWRLPRRGHVNALGRGFMRSHQT